ncbi:unnamed protein product [Blepharisma stoltei]|uniref:TmcB/TmcC TPR repeats domain-containing protein n=1 Tax=Blepharisma stoltei TaxID=1481888 RepID=A0AAU9JAL0_9CILI|nr:unnamed protein product [Blepharisma stoltei]
MSIDFVSTSIDKEQEDQVEMSGLDKIYLKKLNKASLKSSVFELFHLIYFNHQSSKPISLKKKIIFALLQFFMSFQLITLLWIPKVPIYHWKNNYTIWEIAGYLRLDNIGSDLNIMTECIYGAIILISVSFFIIGIFVILTFCRVKIPEIILQMLKGWLNALSTVFFIPSVNILCKTLKYYIKPTSDLSDYEYPVTNDDFQVNIGVACSIPVILLVIFVILFIKTSCSAEIRHSLSELSVDSQAHSKIELKSTILTIFLIILNTILVPDHLIFYQVISLITSMFCAINSLIFQPYFSKFANIVLAARYFTEACAAIIFLIGAIFDSSVLMVYLSIFVLPSTVSILIRFFLFSKRSQNPGNYSSINCFSSIYDFELKIRPYLIKGNSDEKEEIIKLFSQCTDTKGFRESKLLIIWEANYCHFSLKDETLAKVKLCKTKNCDWSLENDFQEFRCRKELSEMESSEEAKYLTFLEKIETAKTADRILCFDLLNIWNEVTSKSPSLKKLTDITGKVYEGIEKLHTVYSYLLTQFPTSTEPLILYGTLLNTIMLDKEKSMAMLSKQESLQKTRNFFRESQKLSCFDESVGILLISIDDQSFGDIYFSNTRSTYILKQQMNQIIGANISNFIPPPYNKNLQLSLTSYINELSHSEIYLPETLFVLDGNNLIIECCIKVVVSALFNNEFMLFLIKEKEITYQFAIYSDNGEILAHSEFFGKYMGLENKSLKGWNLDSLIPNFPFSELTENRPYDIINNGKEITLIISCKEIEGLRIKYIQLLHDPITSPVKLDNEVEEIEESNPPPLNKKTTFVSTGLDDTIIEEENVTKVRHSEQNNLFSETGIMLPYENKKLSLATDKNDKSFQSTTISSSNSGNILGKKLVAISSRSIKIFNYTLILSILAIIITNCIVLYYTSTEVNKAKDLSLLITLGKITASMASIANQARSIEISRKLKIDTYISYYENSIQNNINYLISTNAHLLENVTSWSQCSGIGIFTENEIDIWDADGTGMSKANLIDTISKFAAKATGFISEFLEEDDYKTFIGFLAANGLGNAHRQIKNTISSIVDCEQDNVHELTLKVSFLLGIGFGVLVLCVIIMIPFICSIDNVLNTFWNKIKSNAYQSYFDLRQACIDRLSDFHGQTMITRPENSKKLVNQAVKFTNAWSYIIRLCMSLVAAFLFFMVNLNVLYKECESSLNLRPELLETAINRRLLVTEVAFWGREKLFKASEYQLVSFLNESYPFEDADYELKKVMDNIKDTNSYIRKSKTSDLLSKSLEKQLYESIDNPETNKETYGTYGSMNIHALEALYYSYSLSNDSISSWVNDYYEINMLRDQYNQFIDSSNSDSEAIIEQQFTFIILIAAFYMLLLLSLYIFVYAPFLRRETQKLKKMRTLLALIPIQSLEKCNT